MKPALKNAPLSNIRSINERVAAWLELERDSTFKLMSAAQRLDYVDRSLQIGTRQAERFAGKDPFDLAAEWGLHVGRRDEMEKVAGATLRSVYDGKAMAIELSNGSVTQVEMLLARLGLANWPLERVEALHVAHELFHNLESRYPRPCDNLPKIATWKLGPFCLVSERPLRCSEIAAHAFAMRLCGLPFMPSLIDLLLQIDTGTLSPAQFEERVTRAKSACE
jgi:hypothetical protein